MTGTVDEADMSDEAVLEAVHGEGVLLAARGRSEADGSKALRVVRLVDLGIGVAKLDCDVSFQFIFKPTKLKVYFRKSKQRSSSFLKDKSGLKWTQRD